MRFTNIINILYLLLLLTTTAYAANNSALKVGFYSLGDHTVHRTNVDKFRYPGSHDGNEVVGTGNGISMGFLFERRLDDFISLGMRIGMNSYQANFQREKNTTIMHDEQRIYANYVDKVEIDISEIGIMPMVKFHWNKFGVFGGLNLSILNDAVYDSYHELTSKFAEGEFLDDNGNPTGNNYRDPSAVELPKSSDISANILLGVNYDIAITNSFTISPETSISKGLISPINNYDWNYYHYNYGVSFKYTPIKDNVISAPLVSISLFPLNDNGEDGNEIEYEENITTSVVPLLNSIYFEPGSTVIPNRYQQINPYQTTDYYINSYCSNIMTTYHDILNIIGRRLQSYAGSKITLRAVIFDEKITEVDFYFQRAYNIKDYLVNTWNIDSNRFIVEILKINSNNFEFAKYKNSPLSYGNIIEEHHRVDIIPENMEIIAPVIVHDTTHKFNTTKLSLMTFVSNDAEVNDWDYELKLNNNLYHSIDGEGEIPQSINIPVHDNFSQELPAKFNYKLKLHTNKKYFAFNGELQLKGNEKKSKSVKYYMIWREQDQVKPDKLGIEMAELINLSVTNNSKMTTTLPRQMHRWMAKETL